MLFILFQFEMPSSISPRLLKFQEKYTNVKKIRKDGACAGNYMLEISERFSVAEENPRTVTRKVDLDESYILITIM